LHGELTSNNAWLHINRAGNPAFDIAQRVKMSLTIQTIPAVAAQLTTEDGRCVEMPLSLTFKHIFKPSTMSVVAVVASSCSQAQLPPLLVLKLFDRRFAEGLRVAYDAGAWTPGKEHDFRAFNSQENKPRISVELESDSWHDSAENPAEWSDGEREAYLQEICRSMCTTELAAYRKLQRLQGTVVPKIYGSVRCDLLGGTVDGFLLEYLGEESFTLDNIPMTLGHKEVQEIGDSAVKAVSAVGDQGVINCDLHLGNVMVVPGKVPRVAMIDFGMVRLRRVGESDERWRKCRRFWDREGELGYALENHEEGGFQYVDDDNWLAGDEREKYVNYA
jgi:hypothetical protein